MAVSLQVMYVSLHGNSRARLRGEQAYLLPHIRPGTPAVTDASGGEPAPVDAADAPADAADAPAEPPGTQGDASPPIHDRRMARVLFSAPIGSVYEHMMPEMDLAEVAGARDEESRLP